MNATLATTLVCIADHALPRLPVVLHEGLAGRILVAGTERWSRYLPDRFFGGGRRTSHRLGAWPVWRLHDILTAWRDRADILIARVDLFSARRFPATDYVRVPEWIRMIAPVQPDGMRLRSSQARRNEQLIQRNGLSWRTSHDPRDLATFIERDYRPYIRARYGMDAHIRSSDWFQRRFRDGGLVWIDCGCDRVAGILYDVRGRVLRRLAVACVGGDTGLLQTGAMSATYLACHELARSLACSEVDFRNCRPCLADGLLQVKRCWGGRLVEPDDLTHDLLVGWSTATPAVKRFLAASPLIVRDGRGYAVVHGNSAGSSVCREPPGITSWIAPVTDGRFGEWIKHAVPS
jgi:hypothetical protein